MAVNEIVPPPIVTVGEATTSIVGAGSGGAVVVGACGGEGVPVGGSDVATGVVVGNGWGIAGSVAVVEVDVVGPGSVGPSTGTAPVMGTSSVGVVVSLSDATGRVELRQQIVDELHTHEVAERTLTISNAGIGPGTYLLGWRWDVFRLDVELEIGDAERAGVVVRASEGFSAEPTISAATAEGTLIGYDTIRGEVFVDRTRSGAVEFHPDFAGVSSAPVPTDGGVVGLEVYVDRTSVEMITADGRCAISSLIFPDASSLGLGVFALGGAARLRRLDVVPLRGAP